MAKGFVSKTDGLCPVRVRFPYLPLLRVWCYRLARNVANVKVGVRIPPHASDRGPAAAPLLDVSLPRPCLFV